jgi:hypothetical protein
MAKLREPMRYRTRVRGPNLRNLCLGRVVGVLGPIERTTGRIDQRIGQCQFFLRGRSVGQVCFPGGGCAHLLRLMEDMRRQQKTGGTHKHQLTLSRHDHSTNRPAVALPHGLGQHKIRTVSR